MNSASVFSLSGLLAAAALALPGASALAQAPGSLDPAFTPALTSATVYTVLFETTLNNTIIFAAGDLGFEDDLQPDGVEKGNFVQPTFGSVDRIIYTAVPERFVGAGFSLPKVVLGGVFGQSATQIASNTPEQNITRISPDGTQDPTFNPGAGANGYVTAILTLTNGKIVVGGEFTSFNNQPDLRIVRLFGSGATDPTFRVGGFDGDVLTLAEGLNPANGLADGTTLVGGDYNNCQGKAYGKLVRLDSNGYLDTTFHPVIDTRVLAIAVQKNGKIIIGGDFSRVNGVAVSHIARLNHDGSLDTTFTGTVTGLPQGEPDPVAVYVLRPLSDGRIYVGGNFTAIDGVTRRYLGLISANGVLDTTFNPGTNIYDKVQTVYVQPNNGRVLIGETLGPKIGKNYQPSLIRLIGASTGQ